MSDGNEGFVQNGAGFSKPELDEFDSMLREHREKLLRAVGGLAREALKDKAAAEENPGAPVHRAELATDLQSRDVALGLLESEQRELGEISEAFGRLADGSFGTCRACGGRIQTERLRAIPYTPLCLDCKRREERDEAAKRGF